MDDLRVLKGSFKNVSSTVDCENSLAMDSGITKLRKRSPTTDVRCDRGRRATARAERLCPRSGPRVLSLFAPGGKAQGL